MELRKPSLRKRSAKSIMLWMVRCRTDPSPCWKF